MRAWLHEKNIDLDERDFFQNPFTEPELRTLLPFGVSLSNHHPAPVQGRAALLFSWKSPSFRSLSLCPENLADDDLIRLMLQEPRLIRRPLVQVGDRLIIGADLAALEAAFS